MRRWKRRELLELVAKAAPAVPLLGTALGAAGCGVQCAVPDDPATGLAATGAPAATSTPGPTASPASTAPNEPLPENLREVLRAAMARIFPADDGPGALELGAFDYLEKQLALPIFKAVHRQFIFGAVVIDRMARTRDPAKRFHELDPALQDDLLLEFANGVDLKRDLDTKDLFQKLLAFTVEGCFCPPSYGGNKDGLGWKLIGFTHHL